MSTIIKVQQVGASHWSWYNWNLDNIIGLDQEFTEHKEEVVLLTTKYGKVAFYGNVEEFLAGKVKDTLVQQNTPIAPVIALPSRQLELPFPKDAA